MDERAKFVFRVKEGERMSDLYREFNISRKTGYKIYERFQNHGLSGLINQKRGPIRAANATATYLQKLILETKKTKPTWGAPKLRSWLIKKYPHEKIPSKSTVHNILDKNGLVKKKSRRTKFVSSPTNLSNPINPNDLWCVDYKGQFRMRNNSYCYPLTVTDQISRYILSCEGFNKICGDDVKIVFEELFDQYGLPQAIRNDNGEPFSSRSIWGLSKLSVWWLRMGIKLERIRPGNPQENGRHERMHRTLKESTTKPPGKNLLNQQELFNLFKEEYNNERPHESLGMQTPSHTYQKSSRKYQKLQDINYVDCDTEGRVSSCGSLLWNGEKTFISRSFAGERLGITEVEEDIWEVKFMDHILGYIDKETNRLSIGESPFIYE